MFYDGHNQPVHQAAPGLLGIVEGHHVMRQWKPQIVRWLDDTEHFFNHLFAEFRDEQAFEPVGRELQEIRALDAPLTARNHVLFQHLRAWTRELERDLLASGDLAPDRDPSAEGRLLVPAGAPPVAISLAGGWTARYRQGPGSYLERVVDLPVNWELLPWIEDYAGTMRLTRVFSLGDLPADRRAVLRLDGVDYFADLWVNGHYVGGHEGYFGPFEFDVSPFVRPHDDNILRLAVTSPNDPSGSGTHVTSGWHDFSPASAFPNRKTLIKGTLGHHDAKRGGAWSSMTSQDGNTGGVWNQVTLRVLDPVHFTLPGPRVTTLAVAPGATPDQRRVRLHVAYSISNAAGRPLPGRIRVKIEPANFDGGTREFEADVVVAADGSDLVVEHEVDGVRLWEPRDHGFPHLYRVTSAIEVGGTTRDTTVVETGFRTLAVSPIGESEGRNGAFVVNGRRLFVRGTNLLPTYWLSEYTPDRVTHDFDMLTDGGFNAVLVHNLVLPKWFYEEANRRGFLVVQMFPLQWSYEQSRELQARATAQISEMANLLMNEPSVVSYEVHNEPDMRIAEDLDNRLMDFDMHLALREADPSRWATTFSSGNHAYPGQFYPLRDDNAFPTLPGRFLEEQVHGRRISRHQNMPTEFGIQAMPHPALLAELLDEERVVSVLQRLRTDPKWLAAGADSWEAAEKTIDEAKQALGNGAWKEALRAFDWRLLWRLGDLQDRIARLERAQPQPSGANDRELLSSRLALLLLDVLHYGAFKGENFWFGLWRPARTLEDFVASSQERQYRLHKDAIETYLNAGVVGPIVGYFGFMFRDADWEAPTWGVVDAAWVPKKAYRAYVESNHALRVSLPYALRTPVKFEGDPWFTARGDAWEHEGAPWVATDLIVANDTGRDLADVHVTVWLERDGEPVPLVTASGDTHREYELRVDVGAQSGWSGRWPHESGFVPAGVEPGTYVLKARVEAAGALGSTNTYELLVLDHRFADLSSMTKPVVTALLDGAPRTQGFHYWQHGAVAYRARPGMRGLLRGFREVQAQGVDLYEVVQGEHLFRHALEELSHLGGSERLIEDVWRIRSEIVSPREKARALLRHLEQFVERAEARLAGGTRARSARGRAAVPGGAPAAHPTHRVSAMVGRDVPDERMKERGGSGED